MAPCRQPRLCMVVRRGENLWTPAGTHITDPVTGMSTVAEEDTQVTFESAAAHRNALVCAEEQRRQRAFTEAAQRQAMQRVSRGQEMDTVMNALAGLQAQIDELRREFTGWSQEPGE